MELDKLIKGSVFVFLMTFFGLGLNYLFGLFLARVLGADSFGLYSLGLSVFTIFSLISVIGLDNAVLHFLPEYKNRGDHEAVRVKKIFSAVALISGVVFLIILLSLSNLISVRIFEDERLKYVLALFAIAIPAYSLSSVVLSILQARRDVYWRITIKYAIEPVIKFILVLALIYFGMGLNGVLYGFVVALYVSLFLVLFVLRKRLFVNDRNKISTENFRQTVNKIYIYCSPLVLGMIFSIVATRSDYLLAGYYLNVKDVGFYAAAFQTAAILSIILQSIESVLAPYMASTFRDDDVESKENIYKLSLRWMFILGLPLYILFVIFSEDIMKLYGSEFVSAQLCFVVLSTGHFINLATGSANYVLLLTGNTRYVMFNEVLMALVQVVMNLFMIKNYGIVGAAITMIVTVLLTNYIRIRQVFSLYKIQPYDIYLFKPILIVLFILLCLPFLGNLTQYPVEIKIGIAFIFMFVYFLLLILIGLKDEDAVALKNIRDKLIVGRV